MNHFRRPVAATAPKNRRSTCLIEKTVQDPFSPSGTPRAMKHLLHKPTLSQSFTDRPVESIAHVAMYQVVGFA